MKLVLNRAFAFGRISIESLQKRSSIDVLFKIHSVMAPGSPLGELFRTLEIGRPFPHLWYTTQIETPTMQYVPAFKMVVSTMVRPGELAVVDTDGHILGRIIGGGS